MPGKTDVPKQRESAEKTGLDYYLAANVWPSCHHDERFGDMLWLEGMGEWEIIHKSNPRFEGHYQPRRPLWGYKMDNDPEIMEKWIETATRYGANVFIFDWYDGGPFLESALNDGVLKAENNFLMQFHIMWANHDARKNYWNVHKFKDDTSILWNAVVDAENFRIIVKRVIDQYFKQGTDEDYLIYGSNSIKIRAQMDSILNIPLFSCVSVGWDDTPRFPTKGLHDVVHYHNIPESFAVLLDKAKQYADIIPNKRN